jgi:hypothetical protein
MNVYLYGGSSKSNSTIPIIDQNTPVKVGKTYTIPSSDGMLLIAYPNHNVTTDFAFTYWVARYTSDLEDSCEMDESNCVNSLNIIIIGAALFLILIAIICLVRCLCKKRVKAPIISQDTQMTTKQVDTSVDMESIEQEEHT